MGGEPLDPCAFHCSDGILQAVHAVIVGVVVGQGDGLHAGGGEDVYILGLSLEKVGAVLALLHGGELAVGQHALQVDDGQVILGEEVRKVLQEVLRAVLFIHAGEGVRLAGQALLAAEGHVAGKGDGDGLVRQSQQGQHEDKQQANQSQ